MSNENKDLREWLKSLTPDPISVIAKRWGVDGSNLTRQIKGETPIPPATVVRIARDYGFNPVPGLAEAGLITAQELSEISALQQCTDQLLIAEIERRLGLSREAQ